MDEDPRTFLIGRRGGIRKHLAHYISGDEEADAETDAKKSGEPEE